MWKTFSLLNNDEMKRRSRLTDGHIKFVIMVVESRDWSDYVDDGVTD
jgi:hypothetical protein